MRLPLAESLLLQLLEEWEWVKDFQKQTGLTVTLIATTAPAYENNKMYNLAEQARIEGTEVRPQAAGRRPLYI